MKPIAHTFLNQVRGQLMYIIRFVVESGISTLVLLGPFGSYKYLGALQKIIKIPILYLLPNKDKPAFSYLEYKSSVNRQQYISSYPLDWSELYKIPNYGLFCAGWNMRDVEDGRPTQSHYLGIYSKIYNILYFAKPTYYLLGFEPYIGPHEDIALLPKYKRDIDLSQKLGYDHVAARKKEKWLYFSGETWLIPYGANKATRFLIFGRFSQPIKLTLYDIADCGEKMMYYNEFDRGFNLHPNKFADIVRHYDYCNDCALDAYILENYCKKYKTEFWHIWDYLKNEINNNLFIEGHGLLFSNKKDILLDMFRHESALIANCRFSGL